MPAAAVATNARLNGLLEAFLRQAPDVWAVAVLHNDGIVLHVCRAASYEEVDIAPLGAACAGVLAGMERALTAACGQAQGPALVHVGVARFSLLCAPLSQACFVAALMPPDAIAGRARFFLQQSLAALAEALAPVDVSASPC